MNACRIARWISTADPSRVGVEVHGFASGTRSLKGALDRADDIEEPAFVIYCPPADQLDAISKVIARLRQFYTRARICIALDYKILPDANSAFLRESSVGVLLDRVDADTPLSAIASDMVKAVRFDEEFVGKASRDLRHSCIVDSMMSLAHDLGLATLGSGSEFGPVSDKFGFDYIVDRRSRVAPASDSPIAASGNFD